MCDSDASIVLMNIEVATEEAHLLKMSNKGIGLCPNVTCPTLQQLQIEVSVPEET